MGQVVSRFNILSTAPPSSSIIVYTRAAVGILLLKLFHRSNSWFPNIHKDHMKTEVTNSDVHRPLNPPSGVELPLTSLIPMFALVIGINNYPSLSKLRGAVPDAHAIKDYLEDTVRVPQDHIRTLFDNEATRDAIIKAFEDLRDDRRIHNGDLIFIYYAGHGGELDPPRAWGVKKRIQCLLPHDYRALDIHPIPDRTIGSLIEDIAKSKGDNIVVIFDCCHSASGTRDGYDGYVPRSVLLDQVIPVDLDNHIWSDRAGSIPQGWAYHGLRSHVLLAACGEEEVAYERDGHGQFTTALLATLKETAINSLTYAEVLRRIHLPKQNPRCEGVNQDRVLFNTRASAGGQGHTVRSARGIRGCKYVISAGLAHGVSHGTEFTIYSDRKQRVDVVVVDDTAVIEDFQTTITIPVHLAEDSFAKLTRVGEVPFYLAPGRDLDPLLEEMLRTCVASVKLVEKAEEAKLVASVDDNLAIFKVLDQRVNAFGLRTLPYRVAPNKLARVLSAAARYFWYLDLTNRSVAPRSRDEISFDFFPLMIDYDDYGEQMYVPVEPGFCQKDPNSGNDVIDFVVDSEAVYGIKITNRTPWDLYLNAFVFNNSSLNIKSCYTQAQSSNKGLEAPLKRNETLSIGYGPGGSPPFRYLLENGQDVDVSFLKVFFATQHIDLSMIEQATPFVETKERDLTDDETRKARLSLSKFMSQASRRVADVWFTIEIPVVQRRAKPIGGVL